MKAIQVREFGDPEVMQLEETDDPTLGAGQVLINVRAVGVNPVETYLRSGVYTFLPNLPYTPGSDAAGVVEAVGDGVEGVSVGDRVYTAGTLSGAYAEKVLCAASQVFALPENITFEQGSALGIPYGTAHRALFHRAQAQSGETVLVHGASGGVGIAAVQLAKDAGMTVIATAGTDAGLALVEKHGADHAVNHNDEDHLEKALKITRGNGLDVILEMLANVNLGADLSALGRFGRVVVIGSRGTVEIDPRDLMTRDATILGMSLINLSEQERIDIHTQLIDGMKSGALSPEIDQTFSLSDAALSHHAVMESSHKGKIVLIP